MNFSFFSFEIALLNFFFFNYKQNEESPVALALLPSKPSIKILRNRCSSGMAEVIRTQVTRGVWGGEGCVLFFVFLILCDNSKRMPLSSEDK